MSQHRPISFQNGAAHIGAVSGPPRPSHAIGRRRNSRPSQKESYYDTERERKKGRVYFAVCGSGEKRKKEIFHWPILLFSAKTSNSTTIHQLHHHYHEQDLLLLYGIQYTHTGSFILEEIQDFLLLPSNFFSKIMCIMKSWRSFLSFRFKVFQFLPYYYYNHNHCKKTTQKAKMKQLKDLLTTVLSSSLFFFPTLFPHKKSHKKTQLFGSSSK